MEKWDWQRKYLTNAKSHNVQKLHLDVLRKWLGIPFPFAKIIIPHICVKSQDLRISIRAKLIVNCHQQGQLHSKADQIPHNQANKSKEFPTSIPKYWANTTEFKFL